ncbi:MAG: hypothetical protein KatS3mg129_2811 [Leptospiraceae bacterium]|nr:MAG: hypothetical protein KatS3mg129_2811 [Leptospiraceae bacterium]
MVQKKEELDIKKIEVSDEDLYEEDIEDQVSDYKIEPIEIDIGDDLEIESQKAQEQSLEIQEKQDITKEELDDEPISLSDDELDNILSDLPEEEISEEQSVDTHEESDIQDELIITDDELAKTIISDTEETKLPPLSEVELEEDDSISLTPEELEEIVSSEDINEITEELKEEIEEDLSNIKEEPKDIENIEIPEPIFDDNSEETISLTDDELKNIVGELQTSEEISIPEPEIYESKAQQQIDQQQKREQLTDDLEKETGIKKEELKKIIAYLDSLFDQLPEETIKEFSRSEYFNLYKKVIESLGIYPPDSN